MAVAVQKDVMVYNGYKAVVPSDFIPVALQDGARKIASALFVGTGGDVALVGKDGAAPVVFKNVPSGTILNTQAVYVKRTGTTASDIVAFYLV